jgi:hypothetical protein
MVGFVETPSELTGYTYIIPGIVGDPLTVAKSADSEGLKVRSETVFGGPIGGVLWFKLMDRSPPRGVRPVLSSVAKQETPPTAPPLITQARPRQN